MESHSVVLVYCLTLVLLFHFKSCLAFSVISVSVSVSIVGISVSIVGSIVGRIIAVVRVIAQVLGIGFADKGAGNEKSNQDNTVN